MTRDEVLDNSIVQKELADIQSAFQRFKADCAPTQEDYKLISRYGLSILGEYDSGLGWDFELWNSARNRGWRGPYIDFEGSRAIDATMNDGSSYGLSTKAQIQRSGGVVVPVLEMPYGFENGEDFYRVLPELNDSGRLTELYVVAPLTDTGDLVAGKDATLAGFATRTGLEGAGAMSSYQTDLEAYLEYNPCRRRLLLE